MRAINTTSRVQRWMLTAGFLASLAVCLTPITSLDLPWHLSAGRYIVEHHQIPSADFLSWTQQGKPWIDFEWGIEIVYYALNRLGGMTAIWLFKTLSFAAILILFAALLRLWRLPNSWIGLSLFPFIVSLIPALNIRPENLSFIFCMFELYALEALRLGRSKLKPRTFIAAHAALYALWANLHAAFPVGLGLCLIYGIGEAIDGRRQWRWFLLATAGFLGSLINPYGIKIYGIFLEHWKDMPLLKFYIIEWDKPNLSNLYQRTYWMLFLFSYLAFILNLLGKRRVPYAHWLSVIVFSLLSAQSYRQISYFSLIVFPMGLLAVYPLKPPFWWLRLRPYILACLFAFWAKVAYQVPKQRMAEIGSRQPSAACDFLSRNKQVLAPLKMYNPWNAGGYLGYALDPDFKVFMDGRYIFTSYLPLIDQAMASPKDWKKLMEEQGIQLVFLEHQLQSLIQDKVSDSSIWRPLDVYYLPRRDWALVYWDSQVRIWVRRSSVPADWLLAHEFQFIHPRDFQFLSDGIFKKALPLKAVLPEIWRYFRDTRDIGEGIQLIQWVRTMQNMERRGLAGSDVPDILLKPRESQGTEDSLKAAISEGSKDPNVYRLLAEAFIARNDTADLRRLCEAAAVLFPHESFFKDRLAELYRESGDWEALGSLRLEALAMKASPALGDYLDAAEPYILSKHFSQAIEVFEKAKSQRPEDIPVIKERIRLLEKMAKAIPSSPPASSNLSVKLSGRWTVTQGPWQLRYPEAGSPEPHLVNGQEAGARDIAASNMGLANHLTQRLLEYIETIRFKTSKPDSEPPNAPDIMQKLHRSGYVP